MLILFLIFLPAEHLALHDLWLFIDIFLELYTVHVDLLDFVVQGLFDLSHALDDHVSDVLLVKALLLYSGVCRVDATGWGPIWLPQQVLLQIDFELEALTQILVYFHDLLEDGSSPNICQDVLLHIHGEIRAPLLELAMLLRSNEWSDNISDHLHSVERHVTLNIVLQCAQIVAHLLIALLFIHDWIFYIVYQLLATFLTYLILFKLDSSF